MNPANATDEPAQRTARVVTARNLVLVFI
jgi:hypothetical protein